MEYQYANFLAVKLTQSVRRSLSVRVPSPVRSNALVKLSVLEILLDKELTVNCLVETRTKLKELIPAAMVNYGLNRVQRSPCGCSSPWLVVSLGMVYFGPQWSAKISKVCWGQVDKQSSMAGTKEKNVLQVG